MTDTSPQIPSEPKIQRIPVFSKGPSSQDFQPRSCLDYTSNISVPRALKKWRTDENLRTCGCPHVLVADDDPFQIFYYQTLFNRSMEFGKFYIKKQDFRIKMYKSGEDLLQKYQEMEPCPCGTNILIILDFYMGNNKLDGIETALVLRKKGYKGAIILRTSEIQRDLENQYADFKMILEDKLINFLLDKSNHKRTKELFQSYLVKEIEK